MNPRTDELDKQRSQGLYMSNIYYQNKQLLKNQTSGNSITYDPITPELVEKIIRLDICSISWPETRPTEFHSFSWRKNDIFYQHKDLGQIYIPINIILQNTANKYFIVMIDGDIEIVKWVGEHKTTDQIEIKLEKSLVESPTELEPIKTGFMELIEELGVNKPFKERYAHIKGNRIKSSHFDNLVGQLINSSDLATKISNLAFESAQSPVDFFEQNTSLMQQFSIDEPSKDLYKILLCELLEQQGLLFTLDWKFEPEDLQYAIRNLSKGKIDCYPENKLAAIKACKDQGFSLLNIDLDSDNHQLILIPSSQEKNLKDFAKPCKLKLTEFA